MENSTYFNKELNIYVRVDAVKSVTPSPDGDAWIFEGIASTADMDLYDEVVYPESFLNSIDFFKNNGKIFFDHDYAKSNADWLSNHGFSKDEILAIRTPIGKPLDARVTNEGLHIRAVLNKEHPMARLMWNQYLNNQDETFRDQLGLSIGAKYLGQPRKEYDVKKGKYVTYLPDLLLYEVSLTPEPVNPHTKSWKAAIKSMMDGTENSGIEKEPMYHRIKPDSIQFDASTNQITVKSIVEDSDGVTHVFEQVIDVKEDVVKSMETNFTEKEVNAMDNVVKSVEEQMDTMKQVPPQGAPMVPQQPGDMGQQGAPMQAPMQAGGAPMQGDPAMAQGAPMPGAEGAAMPGAEGAPMPGAEGEMADDGSSSVLEALAEQSDEAGAESKEGEGSQDETMSLVLDKLDALTDIVSQLMDTMHGSSAAEQSPAEAQVTTDVPQLKSIVQEAFTEELSALIQMQNFGNENTQKSVELSEDSAMILADVIKSTVESMEERIVERVTEAILSDSLKSTMKSVQPQQSREDYPVIHPGAIADGMEEKNVDVQVMKSVGTQTDDELTADKLDTLKSMVMEYNNIRGYTSDKSQQRARVIEQAQKELGIHPSIFNVYANKAQKGKF